MSTILKSLKRLEKEKESLASQEQAPLSAFSARHAMHHSVRFAWFKSRLMLGGALAIVLITGAAVLYAYSRSGSTALEEPARAAQQRPAVSRPEPLVAPRVPPAVNAAPRPATQPGARSFAPEPVPINAPSHPASPSSMEPAEALALKPAASATARPPARIGPGILHQPGSIPLPQPGKQSDPAAAPLQPEATFSPGPAGGMDLPMEQVKPVSSAPPSPGKESEPASDSSNHPYADAQRMTDGRLNVQAIVWAAHADDRMAVINNRIVREGAVLEGFTIVAIGEDAVYVNESGRLLEVRFR